MKFTALSMFVGVVTVQVAAGQTPVTSSELFLLRISEAQVSMRPTAGPNNVSNCMIVYPDGRLHLELRRQEFFDGKASVASYEGRLSNQELASLRSVLDSDSVRNLHMFPPPKVPFVGGWLGGVRSRDSTPDRRAESRGFHLARRRSEEL